LPKGKIPGNTKCESGFMPQSLSQTGRPEIVKAYAKKLIDVVGKDGGFIMGPKSAMDESNPEQGRYGSILRRNMVDTIKLVEPRRDYLICIYGKKYIWGSRNGSI